ncbi:MAG: Rieske (2Fe-2S) protein [Pseudonocardiaceae bacterium]
MGRLVGQPRGPAAGRARAHVGPGERQALGPLEEFPLGRPVRRLAGDVPVFVLRRGGIISDVTVLSDRCPHLSAPLHEGELSEVGGEVCITCPWHASVFRLRDGGVVHGPAPGTGARPRNPASKAACCKRGYGRCQESP